ncbi:MAG: hypothetical protein IIB39_03920 [Candidatus Marinimicrobia bacterium]|nr:hypothetical protein [Candidatus Neomarinimicrobiota bacterium]
MSYALRNTLVLAAVLLVLGGLGWGWLNFTYGESLERLDIDLGKKEKRLMELEIILADYDYMLDKLNQTLRRWEYYPKTLLPENSVHETYRYLETISNRRAAFNYEFKLSGVTRSGDVIFANYQLKGSGNYRNINRFIQLLENSKPMYKIESLRLNRTAGGQDAKNEVNITLNFKGMFVSGDKAELIKDDDPFILSNVKFGTRFDPFKPFVLNILPPNRENLLVVERAKVIAILKGLAYIQDQRGNMLTIRVGDKVYLGLVEKINLKKSEVVFAMNRGGIFDRVVLKLEN